MTKDTMRKTCMPQVLAAAMLVYALNPGNPYDYYTVLRFVVCATSGFLAHRAYSLKASIWLWIWGVVAVLFNPIFKIHLQRETWSGINLIVAILMIVSVFGLKAENHRNS